MPDAYSTFCWNWIPSFSKKWLCSVLSCSRSLLLAQLWEQEMFNEEECRVRTAAAAAAGQQRRLVSLGLLHSATRSIE
jgi:hypothetical protein